jgi:hypothetical protein
VLIFRAFPPLSGVFLGHVPLGGQQVALHYSTGGQTGFERALQNDFYFKEFLSFLKQCQENFLMIYFLHS